MTATKGAEMTARQELDRAAAKYRRTYDRLYVASQKAGSAEESAKIDAALRAANAEYDAAKVRHSAAFDREQAAAFDAAIEAAEATEAAYLVSSGRLSPAEADAALSLVRDIELRLDMAAAAERIVAARSSTATKG